MPKIIRIDEGFLNRHFKESAIWGSQGSMVMLMTHALAHSNDSIPGILLSGFVMGVLGSYFGHFLQERKVVDVPRVPVLE